MELNQTLKLELKIWLFRCDWNRGCGCHLCQWWDVVVKASRRIGNKSPCQHATRTSIFAWQPGVCYSKSTNAVFDSLTFDHLCFTQTDFSHNISFLICYLSLTHHFDSVSEVACRLRWDAVQHMLEKLAPDPVHTGTMHFCCRGDAVERWCSLGAMRGPAGHRTGVAIGK